MLATFSSNAVLHYLITKYYYADQIKASSSVSALTIVQFNYEILYYL
jgi:hypothetical protein